MNTAKIIFLAFLIFGNIPFGYAQEPNSPTPESKITPQASPTPSQVPPEISALVTDINDEIGKAFKILGEGQKLSAKSSDESINSREKLNQTIFIAQSAYQKIKDQNLINKIKDSGVTAKESLDNLKKLELFTKYIQSIAFQSIAQTHANLNERQEELNFLRKNIEIDEEILNDKSFLTIPVNSNFNVNATIENLRFDKANILGRIGNNLNEYFGKFDEAIDLLKQSVELTNQLYVETQKPNYKWFLATQLYLIGAIYAKDSKNAEEAIKYYREAIKNLQSLPDTESEIASHLISIGLQQFLQFKFIEALETYNQTLTIYQKLEDKQGQVSVLGQIAFVYFILNNKDKVTEYTNRMLTLLESSEYENSWRKKVSVRNSVNTENDFGIYKELYTALFQWTKNDYIATAYRLTENYQKSLEFYEIALEATPSLKNPNSTRLALKSVAYSYAKLEKWDEAAENYKKALEISKKISGREDIAIAFEDVGWTLMEGKKYDEALKYQYEALTLSQSEGYGEGKNFAPFYSNLITEISQTYYDLGNKRLAILYGKRAVNAIQAERQRLQNLDPVSQKGFLAKKEKYYRRLADWLIEAGRLVEAERVLAMLKEEEVSDYLRGNQAAAEKLSLRLEYTAAEQNVVKNYDEKSGNIAALGAEFGKLEALQKNGVKLNDEQEKRFVELTEKLTAANREFQNFLVKLAEEFKNNKNPVGESQETFNFEGNLEEWGEGVASVYTLVDKDKDKFSAILTTAVTKVKVAKEKAITAEELNKKIFAFREAVKNPNVDPRPLGKELYDILIQPLEKDLEAAKTKTILWYLDGNLRLLPMAALWDGKQYFGQKYQNVVITGKSVSNIGRDVSTNPNVLGLGVSESKIIPETLIERKFTFNALPSVPFELASIVKTAKSPKGVLSGESFLDQGFTKKSLEEQLAKKYKIIHIASHFSINAGDASRSFLLLGDGTILTVREINENPSLRFTGVELLTLSACDTAVGETDSNGKEVEGFAYVAQQNGAKAILATLWSVADNSTAFLMSEFYRIKKANPNLTKAEALQIAQKEMIEGTLKSSPDKKKPRAEIVGTTETKANAPRFQTDKSKPFAHPYYWSPFVLIGNWK